MSSLLERIRVEIHEMNEKISTLEGKNLILQREALDKEAKAKALQIKFEKLDAILEIKSEFISTRQCSDHNGKWPRGGCLQCEVERLKVQLVDIVSFESATLRNRIKLLEKVVEANALIMSYPDIREFLGNDTCQIVDRAGAALKEKI